jgi:hypothetical protein
MAKVNTKAQEYELVSVGAIKPHPRNSRQGDIGAIHESITENGFFGACVVQRSTGHILAGNHRYLAAIDADFNEVPVIWVDVDDDRALRILLADNRTNDIASYDNAALAEILSELANTSDLLGTGFDGDDLDQLIADLANHGGGGVGEPDSPLSENYVRKVEAPIYEIKGDCPNVEDLRDKEKTRALIQRIENADIEHEIKAFLIDAAQRHTVFNYERIAEFYAHADDLIQGLMEDSALVIIDFNKAIENGFVKLVGELAEAYDAEQSEEA